MFDRLGASTTGLDFSTRMLQVARRTSPSSRFIEAEFLSADLSPVSYDAVFAKAFIHLFPRFECGRVFRRIRSVLRPNGLLYIATTFSNVSSEGVLPKADYPGSPKRFRRIWSRNDLINFCEEHGFRVIDEWLNHEPLRSKQWLNIVAEAVDGE
jgi:SAM-dependent methyltransferase